MTYQFKQKEIIAKNVEYFPKMVVTMDELAGTDYQGIRHIHILDFLQQKQKTVLLHEVTQRRHRVAQRKN